MNNLRYFVFEIRKPSGEILFTNFTQEDGLLYDVSAKGENTKSRSRMIECKHYKAKFLTKDPDLIKSKRLFNKIAKTVELTIGFFAETLIRLEKDSKLSLDRLEHNLATYNALSMQEIESLVSQSSLARLDWSKKMDFVKSSVLRDPVKTSEVLLRLAKYSQGTKAELAAHGLLYKGNTALKLEKHQIYQVMMNSLHLFFPDFNELGIIVKMQNNNVEAVFDYVSMNVVLYHMLNNAVKYCIPNHPITISIQGHGSRNKIEFSMMSLKIDETETRAIFNEGYSGIYATGAKMNGRGIGMHVAKQLMEMNNGEIEVHSSRSTHKMHKKNIYELNRFILTIPSS